MNKKDLFDLVEREGCVTIVKKGEDLGSRLTKIHDLLLLFGMEDAAIIEPIRECFRSTGRQLNLNDLKDGCLGFGYKFGYLELIESGKPASVWKDCCEYLASITPEGIRFDAPSEGPIKWLKPISF